MKRLSRHNVFCLLLVSGAVLLGGCSSMPTANGLPEATVTPERYIIGPGDSLKIFVRDNPTLSISVPVRPDGRISIPLVQSIEAAGKTPDELAGELEKALSQYVRSPLVTVIVESFVGAYSQQVRVVGQAMTPKAVSYRSGMTLLDVMIDVGGLTKFAAGNRAKIIRRLPNGGEQTIPVRLGDLMNGTVKDNVVMRPGDILIIPQSLL